MQLPAAVFDIKGLITREELVFLHQICQEIPKRGEVLEIGTFNGRSIAALCAAAGCKRVTSIDNYVMHHHGTNNVELTRSNLMKLGMTPLLMVRDSPLDDEFIKHSLYNIAMLFLDGHHHPETVTKELKAYTCKMPVGSIVAIHAYDCDGYPGYSDAIDDFFVAAAVSTSRRGKVKYHTDWEHIGIENSLIAFRRTTCDES
jgi:predicted O-methyltransferase YrrM